jgi:hypothetical protein
MPKLLFDRLEKKRKRVPPEILDALESGSRVALKMAPETGFQTMVRQDPAQPEATAPDRTKEQALPLPGSATPGGEGREIGKFESNTPNNDIDERPRTPGEPGEDRGHPVNDNTTSFSRRTMTGAVESLVLRYLGQDLVPEGMDRLARWKQRWTPGKRRRRQKGSKRTKARAYYRKNRGKLRRKQRIRRSRGSWKNNPARRRSEKRRKRQNRRMIGSADIPVPYEACAACLAERWAADIAPARERGGEDGKVQHRQKREKARKDRLRYRAQAPAKNRDSKRWFHTVCKRNPKCLDRRKEWHENPKYYERRAPKTASLLTVPDIAFVIGLDMVLGYVNSVSPMTGMVTFRLAATNVFQLQSMPVEVFLRAATMLSEEDVDAFFHLVDAEVGLEAYDDLDAEGLRECAGLYDIDPDADAFRAKCIDLVGTADLDSMSADDLDLVNDKLVMGVLEGGGEGTGRNPRHRSVGDETIPEEYDPHLFYGEVEAQKVKEATMKNLRRILAEEGLTKIAYDPQIGSISATIGSDNRYWSRLKLTLKAGKVHFELSGSSAIGGSDGPGGSYEPEVTDRGSVDASGRKVAEKIRDEIRRDSILRGGAKLKDFKWSAADSAGPGGRRYKGVSIGMAQKVLDSWTMNRPTWEAKWNKPKKVKAPVAGPFDFSGMKTMMDFVEEVEKHGYKMAPVTAGGRRGGATLVNGRQSRRFLKDFLASQSTGPSTLRAFTERVYYKGGWGNRLVITNW